MTWFRGGLVFEAHRLLYHSAQGPSKNCNESQEKEEEVPGAYSAGRVLIPVQTRHPTPYTLHPSPHTLHPTPYILHPARPHLVFISSSSGTKHACGRQLRQRGPVSCSTAEKGPHLVLTRDKTCWGCSQLRQGGLGTCSTAKGGLVTCAARGDSAAVILASASCVIGAVLVIKNWRRLSDWNLRPF